MYATRSPPGPHDIHGTVFQRMPGMERYWKPMSLLNPGVRLRTTWPSFDDRRTMSYSWSRRLPVNTAIRSPDGEGSADSALM